MLKTIVYLFFLCLLVTGGCALEDAEVRNSQGTIEFRIQDGNRVKLPNRHRSITGSEPSLKLKLDGVKVQKVTLLNTTDDAWDLELNDHTHAVLSVERRLANTTEYYLQWFGGGPTNEKRQVCFHYGYNDASWYSTYQSISPEWPLKTNRTVERKPFNHNFAVIPNEMERQEVHFILEHLFINSDGFAILPHHESPLFMSRSPGIDDPTLCFSVERKYPYKEDETDPSYLDLKVRIFTSSNIRTVTDYVVHESGYIPRPTTLPDEKKFLFNWFVPSQLNQTETESYANDLLRHGFGDSELVLQSFDSEKLTFKSESFPDEQKILSELKQKSFRLSVMLLPKSNEVNSERSQKYLLVDKKYPDNSTDTLDFSNPSAREWFSRLVQNYSHQSGIESFHLFPTIDWFQFRAHDPQAEKYPALLTKLFLETVSQAMGNRSNQLSTLFTYRTQHLPQFVQLYQAQVLINGTDDGLDRFIANALSVSLGGYSFFAPMFFPFYEAYYTPSTINLAYRWVQMAALMPSITLEQLPWHSRDAEFNANMTAMITKYWALHRSFVPTLMELGRRRLRSGSPIVRPMWYVAPDDPMTYAISDQFMVGDDVLVAPVTKPHSLHRSVYLPTGQWIDQRGQAHSGPATIQVDVPLDELAVFKRKVSG